MLILYTPVDSYFPVQWGQKEKGDMQYMQYKRVRLWPCKIDLNPPVTLCYEGGSESCYNFVNRHDKLLYYTLIERATFHLYNDAKIMPVRNKYFEMDALKDTWGKTNDTFS